MRRGSNRYAKRVSVIVKRCKGRILSGAFASFITFGEFGAIALVIWFGAGMVHEGQLAGEKLNEFILYALFIGGSIGGLASVYAQLQKAIGATETIFNLMEENPEMDINSENAASIDVSKVAFSKVNFSYPKYDVQVLKSQF